jgi:hypothetical protein
VCDRSSKADFSVIVCYVFGNYKSTTDFVQTAIRRHIITVQLPLQQRSFTMKKTLFLLAAALLALSLTAPMATAYSPICPPTGCSTQ